jgi:glyoxylase-like metal-dependent hydrolase (beta-lactamase superfamily II)/rhodanese-related sulfurtransferase
VGGWLEEGVPVVTVETIETSELGDRSYVAHDGRVAVVVDPQRDFDRVDALLAERGLECALVLETHIHNDYVSGGAALARSRRAPYVVNAADPVSFERRAVVDGDRIEVGGLTVSALATPGHTLTHLAYLVEGPGGDPALFSGGSLLFGSVGRTDLVAPERTEELTRAQHRSAQRLAGLPPQTRLFPTHGFGSFCSSGSASGGEASTIGEQLSVNDALLESDEDAFVARLIANLTAYPAYYAHMGARNLAGAQPPDLSPPRTVGADELLARIAAGEWVVDLRHRVAFAHTHLEGTIGIELGAQFATYLGWLIPWGTPLTLIADRREDIQAAQRQLVRIGIDRPDAAAVGDPAHLAPGARLGSYDRARFDDLAALAEVVRPLVLDVRRDDERARASIPGSLHLPLHRLLDGLDHLPPDAPLWVHCVSGYRASIAAALLARAGRHITLLDDDFQRALELGLASPH